MSRTSVLFRYALLLIVGIIGYSNEQGFFYQLLAPLTRELVQFSLSQFYTVTLLSKTTLEVNTAYIELIPACIAGSAYYLLCILNGTVSMPWRQRILSLLLLLGGFLLLNVARIVILTVLYVNGYTEFNLIHQITWYVLSTALVVALWFTSVAIWKTKQIPIVTDLSSFVKK